MTTQTERPATVGDEVRWGEVRRGQERWGPGVGIVIAADSEGALVQPAGNSPQRRLPWGELALERPDDRPGPNDVWGDGGHLPCTEQEALTETERAELAAAEGVIERGLQSFMETGTALLTIRDKRLYRATHPSFERYLSERWYLSRAYAHRLIEASRVVSSLLPVGNTLPENERTARELQPVPPAQRQEVWQEAVETAPDGRVTAAHVEQVVQKALAGVGEASGEEGPPPEGGKRSVAEPPVLERTCRDCGAKAPVADCDEWRREVSGWCCRACVAQNAADDDRWQVYVDRIAAVSEVLHDEAYRAYAADGGPTPLLDAVEALIGLDVPAEEELPEPSGVPGELALAGGDLVEWLEFTEADYDHDRGRWWRGRVAKVTPSALEIHTTHPVIKCILVDSPAELPGLRRVE